MVLSYCVKQRKQTECVEPSGYQKTRNGHLMFYCHCAECGIKKTRFAKEGSGNKPAPGETGQKLGVNLIFKSNKLNLVNFT